MSSGGIALITSKSFSLIFLVLVKDSNLVGEIGTSQRFEDKRRKAVQANVAEHSPAGDSQLKLRGTSIGNSPKSWTLWSEGHMLQFLASLCCSLL